MKLPIILACFMLSLSADPIVTAEKYMTYKKACGYFNGFTPPKIVLICYQKSTLKHFLATVAEIQESDSFSDLYFVGDGSVAILGGWGLGAPALAIELEGLIALGVKKFVAIGTAGSLDGEHPVGGFILAPQALAEDGVAHLYLKEGSCAKADPTMLLKWSAFALNHKLPDFERAHTWSFSAIYKETPEAIARVKRQGYDVVEMEAATLYAIGQEKGVETLSLFVISDQVSRHEWRPLLKEPIVSTHLHQLADWAFTFCQEIADQ